MSGAGEKRRDWLIGLGLLAVTFAFATALLLGAFGETSVSRAIDRLGDVDEIACDEHEFDAYAWKVTGPDYELLIRSRGRIHEAHELNRCGVLKGMTKAEITALLGDRYRLERRRAGEPVIAGKRVDDGYWAFDAGRPDASSSDSQILYVIFGEDDRVQATRLSRPGLV